MSRFNERDITRSATAVRLGIDNTIAPEHRANLPRLLDLLDRIETALGWQVVLTSAYRSPKLNVAVKGSKSSAHCLCLAVDIEVPDLANITVCKMLAEKLHDFDQIIYEFGEEGWVHVGLSSATPRRQTLTAAKVNGKTVYSPGFTA